MNEQHPRRFVTAADVELEHFPWCRCEWLCRPGLVPAEQLLLIRALMPPGQAHRFHRHPHAEELIYILEGEAEQWVEREKRILRAGDVAHIPMNMVHATHNRSNSPLRFLAILSPAQHDGPAVVDVFEDEPWKHLALPHRASSLSPTRNGHSPSKSETSLAVEINPERAGVPTG